MKIVKILLGLLAAGTLLVGGFTAGSFLTQSRSANAQPVFVQQQPIQPTWVPQQIQPTVIPQQLAPTIPPQGQGGWYWGEGWMMNPNYTPQGQGGWYGDEDWMMNPNYSPQGQQGWGMHDWDDNNWGGMHGGMMNGYGWQTNPNWNPAPVTPNSSPSYPTPSVPVSFKDDVQPIFAARCVACHGGTNGLYLDTYQNILKGGRNGAVVIPGDVYNSRLAYYIYSGYMPYGGPALDRAQIQIILNWIASGAPNN